MIGCIQEETWYLTLNQAYALGMIIINLTFFALGVLTGAGYRLSITIVQWLGKKPIIVKAKKP